MRFCSNGAPFNVCGITSSTGEAQGRVAEETARRVRPALGWRIPSCAGSSAHSRYLPWPLKSGVFKSSTRPDLFRYGPL